MSLTPTHIGSALVLLAGASWGIISIFVRNLHNNGLSPIDIAALRNLGACIAMCCYVAIFNRKTIAVRMKHLWCFAGCGIASITLFNSCYFYTMQHTTVNIAVMLLYTSPVFVSVMSRFFFHEAFGFRKILSVIIVIAGCAFVSLGGNADDLNAISLPALLSGLGSGLCYALYSIYARCAQNRGYTSTTITFWTFIFAGFAGLFLLDFNNASAAFAENAMLWPMLGGLVFVSTLLPYAAYTAGLRRLQPSIAAVIAAVEPVVGTCVGIFVFGEAITWEAVMGMVLIIGAFFL